MIAPSRVPFLGSRRDRQRVDRALVRLEDAVVIHAQLSRRRIHRRELHPLGVADEADDLRGEHHALEQAHRAAGDAEATGRILLALAPQLPRVYGELVRLQKRYAAFQDAEFAAWKRFR